MVAPNSVITLALAKGYQIQPDALKILEDSDGINYHESIEAIISRKQDLVPQDFVINKEDLIGIVYQPEQTLEEDDFPNEVVRNESFEVVRDVVEDGSALEGIDGYRALFQSRFKKFMMIARERPDFSKVSSVENMNVGSTIKIAGLLTFRKVRNESVQLSIETESGNVSAVALNTDVRRRALEYLLDQMVLVDMEKSRGGRNIVKDIRPLDVPDHIINLSKKVVYGVFLSDIHVGCKTFLKKSFDKFLDWLSDKTGEDGEMVKRIKYLVIAGDIVDGVGVYPGQENELEERNIVTQYEMFASMISKVPKDIQIFVSPGNHDATRQALPQFAIPKKYAGRLYDMENLIMLGDPAEIRLHGVNVLVYHGQSLPDVVSTAPNQSFDRPAAAMKLLLKARHLAPTYGRGTSFVPEKNDRLVIESIPDIFHCGHIHTLDSEIYKGTLLLNSGTWQSQTQYQYNMGIVPIPAVAPIVNLSTLEVITKNFLQVGA